MSETPGNDQEPEAEGFSDNRRGHPFSQIMKEKYPDSSKKRARDSGAGSNDAANQGCFFHTYCARRFARLICLWSVVVSRLLLAILGAPMRLYIA